MKIKYQAVAPIIIMLGAASSFAAPQRTEPECLNEQLTKETLLAKLVDSTVASGEEKPPGGLIMTGPFNDTLYQDPNWEKRQWTQYFKNTKMVNGNIVTQVRFTVQIHYMWNRASRKFDQVKFHTTTSQGCEGEKIVETTAGSGEVTPIDQLKNGFDKEYFGVTSYQTVRTGTVTVGPVVPKTLASFGVWNGPGAFGDGSYGGFGFSGGCSISCTTPPRMSEY